MEEPEREELARLRAKEKEQAERIVEPEMERDVLKRCMVLSVKQPKRARRWSSG